MSNHRRAKTPLPPTSSRPNDLARESMLRNRQQMARALSALDREIKRIDAYLAHAEGDPT